MSSSKWNGAAKCVTAEPVPFPIVIRRGRHVVRFPVSMFAGKEKKYDPLLRREPLPGWLPASLFAVIALALSVRLYAITGLEPWYDEAAAYLVSRHSLGYFNPFLVNDKPPLFYFFISLWTGLHASILFARLLEVFAGVVATLLVYFLGRDTVGAKEGLVAALLFAVSPFEALYSRELGPNMLAQVLVLGSIVSLQKYLGGSGKRWAMLSLSLQLVACFTSYVALMLVPAQAAYVWLRSERGNGAIAYWIKMQALFFVPVAIWLALVAPTHILPTLQFVSRWIPSVSHVGYATFVNNLFYGYFIDGYSQAALLAPLLFLAAAGMTEGRARGLSVYFFAPLLVLLILSSGRHLMLQRYLLPFVPALFVLLASGWMVLRHVALRLVLAVWIAAGLALGLAGYYGNNHRIDSPASNKRKEFSSAVAFLERHSAPGEPVFHSSQNSTAVFEALRPGRWANRWQVADESVMADFLPYADTMERLGIQCALPRMLEEGGGALPAWFVMSSWPSHPYGDLRTIQLREELEKSAVPVQMYRFRHLDIARYAACDMDRMDVIADESGGARLYSDRLGGGTFPVNYPALQKGFAGTRLALDGENVRVETGYNSAHLLLEGIKGFVMRPTQKSMGGFSVGTLRRQPPYSGDFTNAAAFRAYLQGARDMKSLTAIGVAPAGTYRLYIRALLGPSDGSIAEFLASVDGTALPAGWVRATAKGREWGWLALGEFTTGGNPAVTIRARGESDKEAEAGIQMVVLSPVRPDVSAGDAIFLQKNFLLERGYKAVFSLGEGFSAGDGVVVLLSDRERGEFLSVRRRRLE